MRIRRAVVPNLVAWALAAVLLAALQACDRQPQKAAAGTNAQPTTDKPATAAPPRPNDKSSHAPKDKPVSVPNGKPSETPGKGLVQVDIELPEPEFTGTPPNLRDEVNLEPDTGTLRPTYLMLPPGVRNVAAGKPVTSSVSEPIVGELSQVTDGDKDAGEGSFVALGQGPQYVQIDLGALHEINAILLWHYHGEGRVYHDVAVLVANDPDFISGVKVLFNNDHDNSSSSGLGIGKDLQYVDSFQGKLIVAKNVKGRYVRFWSNGNNSNDFNHYTEVEIYGKPVK